MKLSPYDEDDREMNNRSYVHQSSGGVLRANRAPDRIEPTSFRRSPSGVSIAGSSISNLSDGFDSFGSISTSSSRGSKSVRFSRKLSGGNKLGPVEEGSEQSALEEMLRGALSSTADGKDHSGRQAQQAVRFKNNADVVSPNSDVRATLSIVIQEFLCPLSRELPIDPVTAEDGRNYDREAIQRWIDRRPRDELVSPATGKSMGPKILPATQVRNAIERAVKAGAISGPKVEQWEKRIETEREVERTRTEASLGDTDAMYHLGMWHQCGQKGLKRNFFKAFEYYERSAEGGNVRGMAAMGFLLVKGEGTPCNKVEGMALITFAACEQGGVDAAAYCLANWYHEGLYGLPKSDKWAMLWLNKVVSGTCSIKDMNERGIERATLLLNKLRQEQKDRSSFSSRAA